MTASNHQGSVEGHTPKVGEYFIERTAWSFDLEGPITKVSDAQVRFHRYRDRVVSRSKVIFSGSEKDCRDLLSVLVGSRSQRDREQAEADQRHQARVGKAIAAALSKAAPNE